MPNERILKVKVGPRGLGDQNSVDAPRLLASMFKPLPEGQLYPVVLDLVEGRLIPTDPDLIPDNVGRHPLFRLKIAMYARDDRETTDSWKLLTQHLDQFKPGKDNIDSPQFANWYINLKITESIYFGSQGVHKTIPLIITPHPPDFVGNSLNSQYRKVEEFVRNLKKEDIIAYIKYKDITQTLESIIARIDNDSASIPQIPGSTEQLKSLQKQTSRHVTEEFTKVKPGSDDYKWQELKANMGWQQINSAINFLPESRADYVFKNVIAALEENLENPALKVDSQIADVEGLLELATFIWGEYSSNSYWNEIYLGSLSLSDSRIESDGFSVPRKFLPSALITYLKKVSQSASVENFDSTMKSLNEHAKSNKDIQVPWLTTLLALKGENIQLQETLEDFVNECFAKEDKNKLRQVLLDQIPGKVWLTESSKLRLTENGSALASAFPIHTSLAPEAEKQIPEVQTLRIFEKPIPIDPRQKTAQEIVANPYFGTIAHITPQEAVSTLEENALRNVVMWDPDELLLNLIELQEKYDHSKQRTLIYVSKLNPHDMLLRDAKHLGIQAVFVDGQTCTFIFEPDVAYSQKDRQRIPAAFQATLDQNGDLQLAGVDGNLQLLFNTLALSLITRDFASPDEAIQGTNGDISKAVKGWNENPKIFRIGAVSESGVIPVEVKGQTILHSILTTQVQ